MKITTKQQMYRLYHAGRFGNRPRSFTHAELLSSPPSCNVSARYSQAVSGNPGIYNLPPLTAAAEASKLTHPVTFVEAIDHRNQLQGEWDGTNLSFTTADGPMKSAFTAERIDVSGLLAISVLRTGLDAGDFDWLQDLITDFPGHTVEFTSLSKPFGLLNRRMIVWEVRAY